MKKIIKHRLKSINSLLYMVILSLTILLLWSCRDNNLNVEQIDSAEVMVKVFSPKGSMNKSVASEDSENRIESLRIVSFNIDSKSSYQKISSNTLYSGGSIPTQFTLMLPPGYTKFYAIANEQESWNLDEVSSIQELEGKIINYLTNSSPQAPFVMFEQRALTLLADQNSENIVDIALKRTIARVRLDLECSYYQSEISAPIIINSIKVNNMPLTQPLVNLGESLVEYQSSETIDLSPLNDYSPLGYSIAGFSLKDHSSPIEFYIPENMIIDSDNATYLELAGEYYIGSLSSWDEILDDTEQWLPTSYKIFIGDGVGSYYDGEKSLEGLTLEDLSVTRNTSYNILATLNSYGDGAANLIVVESQDWEDSEVNGDLINPWLYLNLSHYEAALSGGESLDIHVSSNMTTCGINNQVYNSSGEPIEGMSLSRLFSTYANGKQVLHNEYTLLEFVASDSAPKGEYIIKIEAGSLSRDFMLTIL